MSPKTEDKFRIALSSDFLRPDGSPSYPMFDLSALQSDERVQLEYVSPVNGAMTSDALKEFDALILLSAKFSRDSIDPEGKLSLVARFGVGYDTVDVGACTEFGIGLAITPNGVRRPVAASIITLMLALTSKLMVKNQLTRQGAAGFAQRAGHMGVGLIGKTLGSLGVGNIGAELFRLAVPFELQFIAQDNGAMKFFGNHFGFRNTSRIINSLNGYGSANSGFRLITNVFTGWPFNGTAYSYDTGISVNQGNGGGCLLVMFSNTHNPGINGEHALYLVRLWDSGNGNPTAVAIVQTSTFYRATFGKSSQNTVVITGQKGGNYVTIMAAGGMVL